MKFVDSSIIVAASTPSDPRCEACIRTIRTFAGQIACSIHSFAEVYATLSGRPRPLKMSPKAAAQVVRHAQRTFTVVSLSAAEYLATIDRLTLRGHSGGIVYDALLVACARKIDAELIYTLNPSDFLTVAPDLAARIVAL